MTLTNVKPIQLEFRVLKGFGNGILIAVDGKLDSSTPSDGEHRVDLVAESGRERSAPVKVRDCSRLYVRCSSHAEHRVSGRAELSHEYLVEGPKSNKLVLFLSLFLVRVISALEFLSVVE